MYCIPDRWQVLGIGKKNKIRSTLCPQETHNHSHKWDAQVQNRIQWDVLKTFWNSSSTHIHDFIRSGPNYNLPTYVYYSPQPVDLLASSLKHKTFGCIHWCVYAVFWLLCPHLFILTHSAIALCLDKISSVFTEIIQNYSIRKHYNHQETLDLEFCVLWYLLENILLPSLILRYILVICGTAKNVSHILWEKFYVWLSGFWELFIAIWQKV